MKLERCFCLTFFLLFGFFSIDAQELSIDRNMLRFGSISAYENYAENIFDRAGIETVALASEQLTTMREARLNPQRNGEDLYPDFLLSILNIDKIVNIGGFLVKIDLENDRALVAAENRPNAYELLANNRIEAENIMVFSIEEENAIETLEMIQAGRLAVKDYKQTSSLNPERRECPGAPRYKDNGTSYWDLIDVVDSGCPYFAVMHMNISKVVYQKFIFYFSLQSKSESFKECHADISGYSFKRYVADMSLSGKVKYRKRCRDEINESKVIPSYEGTVVNWRPYEASRSLSHYDFSVKFGIRHVWSPSPNISESRIYRIMAGY